MNESQYQNLEEVVRDPLFPEVDLRLRGGAHIDESDVEMYAFLRDAQTWLEEFYAGYDCDLVRSPDRYWYLRPTGDRMGRKHLDAREMIVGQALVLLLLDPATVADSGKVRHSQVLELLQSLFEQRSLADAMLRQNASDNPAVNERRIRTEVERALRELARLGFCDLLDDETIRLRNTLMRFADPVRGRDDVEASLKTLMKQGAVEVPGDETT